MLLPNAPSVLRTIRKGIFLLRAAATLIASGAENREEAARMFRRLIQRILCKLGYHRYSLADMQFVLYDRIGDVGYYQMKASCVWCKHRNWATVQIKLPPWVEAVDDKRGIREKQRSDGPI